MLLFYAELTKKVKRPIYIWREDLAWPEFGANSGSKIRMFREFDFDPYSVIFTEGVSNSNQVRQLAHYVRMLPGNKKVFAVTRPDKPDWVDPSKTDSAAREFGALVQSLTYGEEFYKTRAFFRDIGALMIPRGVSCAEGIRAWINVGHEIQETLQDATIFVVSGSGATHAGLTIGANRSKVVGLSTTLDEEDQISRLLHLVVASGYKDWDTFNVIDSFAQDGGGESAEGFCALEKYRDLIDFEPDYHYNLRLFQQLEIIEKESRANPNDNTPVILINTGNQYNG